MNRKHYIDVARGIAMICIVLGHLGIEKIDRFVFTFHVPIFFMLTGYFTSDRLSISEFCKKRFKTLIVPYIVTSCIIIVLSVFFNHFFPTGLSQKEVLIQWIKAALYGAGDSYEEPFVVHSIGAIWFLLASFWGSILLRILLDVKPVYRIPAVFLIFFLCKKSTELFWFPLSIQAAGPALLYMYIGYLGKTIVPAVMGFSKEVKAFLFAGGLWVWISFVVQFKSFWLVHCNYGRGVIDILGSICAACCVLVISYFLTEKFEKAVKGLAYLGQYSLIMLCTHMIELDLFPWRKWSMLLFGEMSNKGYLLFRICGKFLWIIPITILLSRWNPARKIFGYKEI